MLRLKARGHHVLLSQIVLDGSSRASGQHIAADEPRIEDRPAC
jgi:hypothetical protein